MKFKLTAKFIDFAGNFAVSFPSVWLLITSPFAAGRGYGTRSGERGH